MKKVLIAVLTVIEIFSLSACGGTHPDVSSVTPIPTSEVTDEADIKDFSPDDAEAAGIELDMTREEAENVLGKPIREESHYEDAFGADVYELYYDFGSVRLEPLGENIFTTSRIIIDKPGYDGPRGIEVGDDADDVLSRFPVDEDGETANGGEKFLYGEEDGNHGIVTYNDEDEVIKILYEYGGGGFGSYTLSIEISNHTVVSIAVSVMNV